MRPDVLGMLAIVVPLAFLMLGRTLLFAQSVIVLLVFGSLALITGGAPGGASPTVPLLATTMLVLPFVGGWLEPNPRATSALIQTFAWLLVFDMWAAVMAFFGPRLFIGSMNVTAMRPLVIRNIFLEQPLGPTSSNFTITAYLFVGTVAALATCALTARPGGVSRIEKAFLLLGLVHAAFGLFDMLGYLAGAPNILDVIRTAGYAQRSDAFFGFKRISGSLSEASAYASFGFPLLILASECWWFQTRRHAGLVAGSLLVVLLASTSTTAYVSIAVYALFFVSRAAVAALSGGRRNHSFVTGGLILCAAGLIVGVLVLFPTLAANVSNMLARVTTGKLDSDSAAVRTSWAAQGTEAFIVSWGLGVGPGSFRSSGMVQALLGSTGIGSIFYLLYLCTIGSEAIRRPPAGSFDPRPAARASLLGLIPAILSGASLDPGLLFGPLAGLAMARRFAQHLGPSRSSLRRAST